VTRLKSGRIRVALHELRAGPRPTLLLLHELWSRGTDLAAVAAAWPGGRVLALDFAGHGRSDRVRGGTYSPETLCCGVDAALVEAGRAYLAGFGLGAYVALLAAGARPERVPAAYLLPGEGMDGGGSKPDWDMPLETFYGHVAEQLAAAGAESADADPMLRSCAGDLRPTDYAFAYAERASRLLLAEDGSKRPDWWRVLRDAASAETAAAAPAEGFAQLLRDA
jgi:pimeloyl-ACP methyl ester carboxylesterase